MKKLLVVFVSLIIATLSMASYGAEGNVEINLSCENVENNRLFDVSVSDKSDSKVCSGEMVISFDDSIVEFRDIQSEDYEVGFKENGSDVHVIFAKSKYYDDDSSELFTIRFKSIDYGSFDLGVTCNECVDFELEKLSVNSQKARVDVTNKGVKLNTKKSSKKNSVTSRSSKVESMDVADAGDNRPSTIDVAENEKALKNILPAIFGVILLAIVFYLGVVFAKNRKLDEIDETDEDDEEDCDEFWM